jgi:hypothetical protein
MDRPVLILATVLSGLCTGCGHRETGRGARHAAIRANSCLGRLFSRPAIELVRASLARASVALVAFPIAPAGHRREEPFRRFAQRLLRGLVRPERGDLPPRGDEPRGEEPRGEEPRGEEPRGEEPREGVPRPRPEDARPGPEEGGASPRFAPRLGGASLLKLSLPARRLVGLPGPLPAARGPME